MGGMLNRRLFKRSDVTVTTHFDLVRWDCKDVDVMGDYMDAPVVDISPTGMGLSDLPTLDEADLKDLETGEKKLRVHFKLDDKPNMFTFARLVWYEDREHARHFGFRFIDIPEYTFNALKYLVEHDPKAHE